MNQIFRKLCMIVLIMIGAGSSFAQITTSGINGKVTGTNGESLPGATVILIHVPSGTQYGQPPISMVSIEFPMSTLVVLTP